MEFDGSFGRNPGILDPILEEQDFGAKRKGFRRVARGWLDLPELIPGDIGNPSSRNPLAAST